MSNIRPISDPTVATAMVATFRSIEHRDALLAAIAKANKDLGDQVVFIGMDVSTKPDMSVEVLARGRPNGAIEIVKMQPPIDPADVPACMRPDCMPPAPPSVSRPPIIKSRAERLRVEQTNSDGRRSAAVARPLQGAVRRDRVAPDRAPRTMEEVAGSNPAAGHPRRQPGRNWIEQRQARIDGAIAFLRDRGVVVSIMDRQAPIRTYFVSANRRSLYAEELVEMAIEWGWVE